MLLFRLDVQATDLIAIVARRGTNIERALTRVLAGVDPEELVDARFVDSKAIDSGDQAPTSPGPSTSGGAN